MPTAKSPNEISLTEVAVELRLHPSQVYQLVCRGELEGRKEGRSWVVSAVSLKAYCARQAQG
jgi:hypothetical protein